MKPSDTRGRIAHEHDAVKRQRGVRRLHRGRVLPSGHGGERQCGDTCAHRQLLKRRYVLDLHIVLVVGRELRAVLLLIKLKRLVLFRQSQRAIDCNSTHHISFLSLPD